MKTTTLNEIKKHSPCHSGWQTLLKYLGKTKADDDNLLLTTILESNGLKDILWVMGKLGYKKEIVLFACDCAESVLHIFENRYPDDKRPREAIKAAKEYIKGKTTKEDLNKKRRSAADVAIYAAYTDAAYADVAAADAAIYAADAAYTAYTDAADVTIYAADAAAKKLEGQKQIEFFKKYLV